MMYGFKEFGFKVGLNNLILTWVMNLLGVKSYSVRYKKNERPLRRR